MKRCEYERLRMLIKGCIYLKDCISLPKSIYKMVYIHKWLWLPMNGYLSLSKGIRRFIYKTNLHAEK